MDYLQPLQALFPGAGAAVLDVLTRTTEPLTLRQIADRADVSHPQVGHHVDRLEALGVVHRHIAGRSHLISLTHSAAAQLLRRLTELHADVLAHMRDTARQLDPAPSSIIVFGSFARGTARTDSDIDLAVIATPDWMDDDDCQAQLAAWTDQVAAHAGNPVAEILATPAELADRHDEPLWEDIRRDGIVILGAAPHQLLDTDPQERR